MNTVALRAFFDELVKIAAEKPSDVSPRVWRNVEYHFSEKAGPERWNKLVQRSSNPLFVDAISKHPSSDEKLIRHIKSMHALSKGKTVDKIKSFTFPGKTYEVRETSSGLGCTCPDWRFRGSLNPGYECKHIRSSKSRVVGV